VYTLGTDATKSVTYEFWPDLRKKLFHRTPPPSDPGTVVKTP
jgi:hypothetical protein